MVAFTVGAKFKSAIIDAQSRGTIAFQKPYDVASGGGRIVVSDTIAHVATTGMFAINAYTLLARGEWRYS
jgi:hypothetical protein